MVAITLTCSIVAGLGIGIFVVCTGGGIFMAIGMGVLAFAVIGMAIGMASAI